MKEKVDSPLVTKKDLEEAISKQNDYLNKALDRQNNYLKEALAEQDNHLNKTLAEMFKQQIAYINFAMDEKFERFSNEQDAKMLRWKSEFYDRVDPLIAEIETAREDREIASQQMENIERRLHKLEQH